MVASRQGWSSPKPGRAASGAALLGLVAVLIAGCGPGEGEPPVEPSAPPAPQTAPAPRGPTRLEVAPGIAIERPISPGEVHEYLLDLERGDYFELHVDQLGVDVGLTLFAPEDEPLLEMDLPTADLGREPLLGVAEQAGDYRLRVEAWETEDDGDSYRISWSVRRPAGDGDRLRAQAAKSFYRGELPAWRGNHRQALEAYEEALEQWRQAGDELWQAKTMDRIGTAHHHLGNYTVAAAYHRLAVEGLRRPGEAVRLAVASNHLALDYYELGEMELAMRQYAETLELMRAQDNRRGQALALGALANIYKIQGETQKALDGFRAGLELVDQPEDLEYRADQLHNLGTLYRRLGNWESALDQLRQAESIYADRGRGRNRASSLSQIGQVLLESGDTEGALRALGQSLDLRRRLRDRRGEAVALRKIGSVLLFEGDLEGARTHYLQALELLGGLERPRTEAAVLAELGHVSDRLGLSEEALGYHRRALAIYEKVGDPVGEAGGLLGVAAAERGLGRLEAALVSGERALEIVESLRFKPYSQELRLSFFSTVQRFFDLYIDLLMELERADPGAGYGARAFQISERARARSLLDLLAEAGAEIRGDTSPQLLEHEREVQILLNRSVALMEDEDQTERQRAAATREVRDALAQLEDVRTAIRRQSPRYSALTQPRPLDAEQIRRRVLDRDTVLLEYRLGPERSFLWVVSSDGLATYELPPAAEIEGAVRRVHALLQRGPRTESKGRARALFCRLSQMLVGPVAGRLGGKRLAIVGDGALAYLPFAALPDPESGEACGEPLVVGHEIVHLPSASTLAVLRREVEGRRPPVGSIAVLADPVFSADDERVGGSGASAVGPVTATVTRGADLPAGVPLRRLRHSRAEAEAVLRLVPPAQAYRALDFDASRQTVLSGRLAGYRIVHFAAHGVLDTGRPALSGLVLSQVDQQGRPVEGRLRAHEIYNLELPADLVVLGGCETALGKEVRGEGLVGLTRGFMYAGAARVIVSLWKVSDRSTADLMQAFYVGLFRDGLAPAAALRRAQLEARAIREEPFYWAGFVLQGDWRAVSPDG